MSMQRPVMNPTFLDDEFPVRSSKRLFDRLKPLFRVLRVVMKILLWDPMTRRRLKLLRIEDGTPWERFCWGLLYRLSFVPVLAAILVAVFVYFGTHPKQNFNEIDPNSQGIYYEPVTLKSEDSVRLEAWLVPVFEANQILREKELALRVNHPAVLLVHDVGQDRQQMLPLVRPLHDAGFVVMVLALRGSGSSQPAASTFGLLEANDVKAALAVLHKRNFVDPKRLAVVGVSAGANAALLAAQDDPSVKAMVLDHPASSGSQTIERRIGPHHAALYWMKPMCKWAFELVYQVHIADLDIVRYSDVLNQRKVLMMDQSTPPATFNARAAKNISRFLSASLLPDEATADAAK